MSFVACGLLVRDFCLLCAGIYLCSFVEGLLKRVECC